MTQLETFQKIFRLPDELLPYIDLVATEQEIDLVVGLGDRALTLGQVAEMMGLGGEAAERFLLEAKIRSIVARVVEDGEIRFRTGNAYRRLTYLSIQDYDGWPQVPEEVRFKVLEWHLEENIRHHNLRPRLESLRRDPDGTQIHNRDILLLDEALEIVEAAELHVVFPCDCRTTVVACDHERWNTCFRLDDRGRWTLEMGVGEIITKEECIEILLRPTRPDCSTRASGRRTGGRRSSTATAAPAAPTPFAGALRWGWPKSGPSGTILPTATRTFVTYLVCASNAARSVHSPCMSRPVGTSRSLSTPTSAMAAASAPTPAPRGLSPCSH